MRWPMAEVQLLEDRTQLTPMTYAAAAASPEVIIEPTATPGVYLLTLARTGALTISLSTADGSQFVGEVALLTPDLRLLVERDFRDESGAAPVTLTELVDPGVYLLRVQSGSLASTIRRIQTQFVPASNPGFPVSVGDSPATVQVVDVNGDGRVDLITPNPFPPMCRCCWAAGTGRLKPSPASPLETFH